ncbi:transcription factor GAGA-like [Toxorhynchites rutilus septentrionalis]|uniref:transcription factor GAGA-like n=1 Tax=Toxorhynchites rutilus septentrionalis TaxID=329112 RepID=UPI0024784FF6|nr:transcription factor GAGA-like [Toxorhynchites rutilus septentrionalis]
MDGGSVCLRWDDHQCALAVTFPALLQKQALIDCTLAAEGQFLPAHKIVLSACSPYFEALVSRNYDKHPIFLLKDVKFDDLRAIVDYMYRGEANIAQNNLSSFLQTAEFLEIKGLSECKNFMESENALTKNLMPTVNKTTHLGVENKILVKSVPLVSSTPLAQKRRRTQSLFIDSGSPINTEFQQSQTIKQSESNREKKSVPANIALKLASNTVKPLSSRNVQAKVLPTIQDKINNTKKPKNMLSPTSQRHSPRIQKKKCDTQPRTQRLGENSAEKISTVQSLKPAKSLKRSASSNLFEIKIEPEPVLYNSTAGIINQSKVLEMARETDTILEPKVVARDDGQIRFVCPQCGSQFSTKSAARIHMRHGHKAQNAGAQCSRASNVNKPQTNVTSHLRTYQRKCDPEEINFRC